MRALDIKNNSIMDLECDSCGKVFNTNAGLYTHKQNMHNTPSVVLVDHNRHGGDHWRPTERKREPPDDIIDPRPRKLKYRHPDDDDELDSDMEIIDESDAEDPPQVVSTDDEDENPPSPSSPIPIPSSRLNYKALYEKCRRNYNKMKSRESRCKKKLNMLNSKHKANLKRYLNELNDKHDVDIADMRERFRKQIEALENAKNLEIDDRIRGIQNEQQATIERMDVDHQDRISELETECEDKIKVLKTHIKDLQDEGEDFTNLSKAIFNCTTIEEIFEIERLVKNHQLDVVAEKHLKTLQNLFLSLSYGILPICDMQRKMVTSKQRELVEKIQTSSAPAARRYLKEGRNEVINLFTVINDSLKLMRNTFNRYGTLEDV